MTDNTVLLPCPFCGGKAMAINIRPFNPHWKLDADHRPNCHLRHGDMGAYATEAEAAEAWNTRAITEALLYLAYPSLWRDVK